MAQFNPTPSELSLLNQIKAKESSNNYSAVISQATCDLLLGPGHTCTASGGYAFIDATWADAVAATGVGTQCPTAASCDPASQDINALWLLRNRGTSPWGGAAVYGVDTASGPAPVSGALVDLSGSAAGTPTASIMDQISAQLASAGVDVSSPATGWLVAAGIGAAILLLSRS